MSEPTGTRGVQHRGMRDGSMRGGVNVLLITGPAGVGKSTLCWEIGAQLAAASVTHAIVDTDELDRVFPRPTASDLERISPGTSDVSSLNLAAIWSTYRALGHSRLVLSGVMMHLAFDLRWITAAIPGAQMTVVRLRATDETLMARLDQREISSGRDEQVQRTLRQARQMSSKPAEGVILVPTDGKSPSELAATLLHEIGWLRRR
jgi:hypothetical protein